MNFNITRHTPRFKRRKLTHHTDSEQLAAWASTAQRGDTLSLPAGHPMHEEARQLKGYARIANRWKVYVTHYAEQRIELLHCGAVPSLKEETGV